MGVTENILQGVILAFIISDDAKVQINSETTKFFQLKNINAWKKIPCTIFTDDARNTKPKTT
jgi:hypothetical protein